jgi:type VI protein secretion system component Hcp
MSFLQSLLPFSGRRVQGAQCGLSNRHVPSVEALEDRMMPAVSPFSLLLTELHRGETAGLQEFISVSGPKGTGKNGAFEIKDFSFGVENPTTIGSATGGAGAGKIKFNEFTIKTKMDQASPAFFRNCVAGAHYKSVTLEMRKAGGDPASAGKPFLQFKFDTVFTTKVDWSGPGDEGPEESITFVFVKLEAHVVSLAHRP